MPSPLPLSRRERGNSHCGRAQTVVVGNLWIDAPNTSELRDEGSNLFGELDVSFVEERTTICECIFGVWAKQLFVDRNVELYQVL